MLGDVTLWRMRKQEEGHDFELVCIIRDDELRLEVNGELAPVPSGLTTTLDEASAWVEFLSKDGWRLYDPEHV